MDTLEDTEQSEKKVTTELVDRVSQRLALGIPIKIALAGEHVTPEDYERHLREHPELAEREDEAKRKLLERAMSVLLDRKDSAANFRWLLERVYKDVIGQGREDEPEEKKQTMGGMTEEEVKEMQRMALLL